MKNFNDFIFEDRMIKSGFHIVNLCAGDTILKPGPLPRKELTVTSVGQGEFTAKPSSGGREESYRTLSGFEPVKVKHLKESATRYEIKESESVTPEKKMEWSDVAINKSINKSITAMAKKIQKEFPDLAIGDVMTKIDNQFKRLVKDSGSSQEKKSVLAGIVYDALAVSK